MKLRNRSLDEVDNDSKKNPNKGSGMGSRQRNQNKEKIYGIDYSSSLASLIDHPYLAIPDKKQRCFGLNTAPTYYPTEEEFQDPAIYLASIKEEAEKFGICKIIPPNSFKPTFSVDLKDFKFHSRKQHLFAVSALNRERINYLHKVRLFHDQYRTHFPSSPTLLHQSFNLFDLQQKIASMGGRDYVVENKLLSIVASQLGLVHTNTGLMSTAIKKFYDNYIAPYEAYINSPFNKTFGKRRKRARTCDDSKSELFNCDICGLNLTDKYVECEECSVQCHYTCITPNLKAPPRDTWLCPPCLRVSEKEIGFEDGGNYTLEEFKMRADEFKRKHFEKLMKSNPEQNKFEDLSLNEREQLVEKEFWRLVDSSTNSATVEYGADLPACYFGSGFPTTERNPLDPISKNPWNLNVLPTLASSMFSNLTTDISGVTVPWLYVGMCFSTFCWHNEDHYAYSLNYQHFGDTKTWYGIPGAQANAFEEAMRKEVPQLFESHPNALSHLAFTISPGVLIKHGVPVYAVDQRPGEFVITFPRAYHAGFNQGLNFNEAVNFAPPDWASFGLECMDRYASFKIAPVFSHDQLLIKSARKIPNKTYASELIPILKQIKERELKLRNELESIFESKVIEPNQDDSTGDPNSCSVCKIPCYLSSTRCKCSKNNLVACGKHYHSICSCPIKKRYLVIHVTIDDLDEMIKNLEDFPISPEEWLRKFDKLVAQHRVPPLALVEELLEEATGPVSNLEEVAYLRQSLNEVYIWREQAKVLLKPKPKLRSPPTFLFPSHQGDFLNFLSDLVERSETLQFHINEIDKIKELNNKIDNFRAQAKQALNTRPFPQAKAAKLRDEAELIHIPIPEKLLLQERLEKLSVGSNGLNQRGILLN